MPTTSRTFRRLAPAASALALALAAFDRSAEATPCDNATEAWTLAGQALDALDANRVPDATRTARTLAACTPSGPQADLVRRAVLEARLAQLELTARPVRELLARVPRPPPGARTDAQFNTWVQRTLQPYVQSTMQRIEHDVVPAVTSLVGDAGDNYSIQADAYSLLSELYLTFGTAVRDMPAPPSIAHNADLLAAYRTGITDGTQRFFDLGAQGYNSVHALAQQHHLEPRGVRRAAAWLEIHGIPTAVVAASDPAPAASGSTGASGSAGASASTPAAPAANSAPTAHPWLGLDFGPAHAVEVLEPVAMALAPLMNRLATCYAPVATASPPPAGRITVRVMVTPAGTAQPAEVTAVDPSLVPIQACVRDTMSTIRFGASANGSLVVQTFEFRP